MVYGQSSGVYRSDRTRTLYYIIVAFVRRRTVRSDLRFRKERGRTDVVRGTGTMRRGRRFFFHSRPFRSHEPYASDRAPNARVMRATGVARSTHVLRANVDQFIRAIFTGEFTDRAESDLSVL